MGRYEIIVKVEEMKKRLDEKEFLSALKILETMDLRKVKNLNDIRVVADVYNLNGRYEEAIELYQKIYNKSKSRKVLFQLVSLSIKCHMIEEAERYLEEYERIAPRDISKYIFRYKLDKIKGEPYEVQIISLEEFKKVEYVEKWAYELAKLYYKIGDKDLCIRECSDIILWFGEGSYVEKAKLLRAYCSGEMDKSTIIEDIKRKASSDQTLN
ncbi:MAG: hypothetical protein GX288_01330 [Clostridiales bacterium]|jgi:tetratricopeptide (TPR) repeat protein|nr:hypothetical protein [Clostridiales bacterium]